MGALVKWLLTVLIVALFIGEGYEVYTDFSANLFITLLVLPLVYGLYWVHLKALRKPRVL